MRHTPNPSSFLSSIWVERAYKFFVKTISQTPGDIGGSLVLPVSLFILKTLRSFCNPGGTAIASMGTYL